MRPGFAHFDVRCVLLYCVQVEHGESTIHMLPFMLPIKRGDGDLRGLYTRVKNAMLKIHALDNLEEFEELERIATDW